MPPGFCVPGMMFDYLHAAVSAWQSERACAARAWPCAPPGIRLTVPGPPPCPRRGDPGAGRGAGAPPRGRAHRAAAAAGARGGGDAGRGGAGVPAGRGGAAAGQTSG